MIERRKCRLCGTELLFVPTPNGRMMPLDSEPNENGNVVIQYDEARVVGADEATGLTRYMPHFATCPDYEPGKTIEQPTPEPPDVIPGQLTLDASGAENARDVAMTRVDHHADREWKHAARHVVTFLASYLDEFTTDQVWAWLAQRENVSTHEPRALGPVMKQAVKDGLIEPTGEYRKSARVRCHARPVAVYRSMARA